MDKGLRHLIDAIATSRLCYGEPVRDGERTIIPVARVRVSGGWGFGRQAARKSGQDGDSGGGGGGFLDAHPAGFIEVGPEGARFHEIPDPDRRARMLKAAAKALTTLLTGVAGLAGARRIGRGARPAQVRRGRRRRPTAGLLGRGR